jgi:hypothetical protein
MNSAVLQDLIVFVSLASHHDDVTGVGQINGLLNGLAPIGIDQQARRLRPWNSL